jgi:hypothetical protein
MATQWVLDKVSDAIKPTINGAVSSAGGFAGGAVNAVGTSINGVGASINRTISGYGNGIMDYGNNVMDWTSATGSRAATAYNPLGLSGNASSGKRGTTSPSIYSPPAQTKKSTNATAKKALPAPTSTKKAVPKTNGAKAPVAKSTAAKPTPVKPGVNPGALKKPAGGAKPVAVGGPKKTISPASKPAAKKPAATPAKKPTYAASSKAATNPIGITW